MEERQEIFKFYKAQEILYERDINGGIIKDIGGKLKTKLETVFYIIPNKARENKSLGRGTYLKDQYVVRIVIDNNTSKFTRVDYGTYPDGSTWNIKNVNELAKLITKDLADRNEGRYISELYPSIILDILENNPENMEYLRFPPDGDEIDKDISNIINRGFIKRHPSIHNSNPDSITVEDEPRFLLIPYSIDIRTQPGKFFGLSHQTFLTVDLDYKTEERKFKPMIFCYDSYHATCRFYGFFNSNLNTKDYFHFCDNEDSKFNISKKPINSTIDCSATQGIFKRKGLGIILDNGCTFYSEAGIMLLANSMRDIENNNIRSEQLLDILQSKIKNEDLIKKKEQITGERQARMAITQKQILINALHPLPEKQSKSQPNIQSHYWRNKIRKSKSTPILSKTGHILD